MSDTVSLDWIGTTLRAVQAEQRSIRNENALIRSALSEAVTVLLDRIAQFEAQTDARIDRLEQRMADAVAGIGELKVLLGSIARPPGGAA
jgi:hypothetical protein